jgi:hypothetical protein
LRNGAPLFEAHARHDVRQFAGRAHGFDIAAQ